MTRVWHLLDDLSIKFVTQQYVVRPEGRALTDMFFPQFQLHLEIDEGHHKKQINWDKLREVDIIDATGHDIVRIDVTKPIEEVNQAVNELVRRLQESKSKKPDFRAWDLEAEQNPKTWIDKGYVDLADDVTFRTITVAASCFGKCYKGLQRGAVKHPKESATLIWFPKLYRNDDWNNRISDDEDTIWENSESPKVNKEQIDRNLRSRVFRRIVFARVKGPLGDVMYRFKGEYQLDLRQPTTRTGVFGGECRNE